MSQTTLSPIAAAIEPLRLSMIELCVAAMTRRIDKAQAELEEGGWDLQVVAPYPHSRMSRNEYMSKKWRHEFFTRLSKWTVSSRPMNAPCPVTWSSEGAARLIEETKKAASASYEDFVAKMEKKVGAHSAAKLVVEGTWNYSVIEVETPVGVQRWKTQQIVNVSVLGKLFNQWPTRLLIK